MGGDLPAGLETFCGREKGTRTGGRDVLKIRIRSKACEVFRVSRYSTRKTKGSRRVFQVARHILSPETCSLKQNVLSKLVNCAAKEKVLLRNHIPSQFLPPAGILPRGPTQGPSSTLITSAVLPSHVPYLSCTSAPYSKSRPPVIPAGKAVALSANRTQRAVLILQAEKSNTNCRTRVANSYSPPARGEY